MNNKPLIRFLVSAVIVYVFWYLLYDLWLHPQRVVDNVVIDSTIKVSEIVLNILGFAVFTKDRIIGIEPTQGLWIGDPCNGISLFALFTGFIVCYPGKLKIKLLYIPFGIITIFFFNVIRVVALVIIYLYSPASLDFNHTYTFTIIIYAYIFFLWMFWVNRFGTKLTATTREAQ